MSRFISKKRALLIAAVTSLALVAVAIAYYSTTGDGTGSGTTAAGNTDLVIAGNAASGLVPGGSVDIDGTVTNNNPGSAKVGTITGSVTTVDKAVGAPAGDCLPGWFQVGTSTLDANEPDVIAGNGGSSSFSSTLSMDDAYTNANPPVAINQDGCKGATVHIDWSSN